MKSNAAEESWIIQLDHDGRNMAFDSNNCIYIAGWSNLIKYNTSGIQLWNKGLNGILDEPIIKTDSTNNVYLAGYYENQTLSWNWTIFKFNSMGDLLWQKVFGQVNIRFITDFAVDLEDHVYIYGLLTSDNLFVIKFNKTGSQLWFHEFEAIGLFDESSNILIDSNYNIIISGSSLVDIINYTSIDWVRSYNGSRDLQWSITYDCTSFPILELDSLNNVISIASTCYELDLIKYDNFGNSVWNYSLKSQFLNMMAYHGPAPTMKHLYHLTLDSSDNIYIGWDIAIPDDIYTSDVLLIKINSSGSFKWYLTWGGPNDDYLGKIGADFDSNIYILTGNCLIKNPVNNNKSLVGANLWNFYFILFGISCFVSLISLYFIIRPKIRRKFSKSTNQK
ncbi:MAG: hypothetical protein ACFFBY_14660 [Promethearchaeota archaeon]